MIGAGTLLPLTDKLYEKIPPDYKSISCFCTGVTDPAFDERFDENMARTRKALKNCAHVGIRSTEERNALGFGEVIGDPFFAVNTAEPRTPQFVVLNVGTSLGNCWGGIESEMKAYIKTLKFVKKVIMGKLKKKVIIISLWGNDLPYAYAAATYLKTRFYDRIPTLTDAINVFNNAEFAITYKLHGMITALVTNTPTIAIEYNPKILNVAKDFKIDNQVIGLRDVTEKTLLEKYKSLKDWDYDFIKHQHLLLGQKQRIFFEKMKKELGETK